jgi:hypothetical protein
MAIFIAVVAFVSELFFILFFPSDVTCQVLTRIGVSIVSLVRKQFQ